MVYLRLMADRSEVDTVDGIIEVALIPSTVVVTNAMRLVAEIVVGMIVDWSVVRTMKPWSVVRYAVEWRKGTVFGHDSIRRKERRWGKVGRGVDRIVDEGQNRRWIMER